MRSDGRVVRAHASGAVDLGLIPSRVKPTRLKLVFTASWLDTRHLMGQRREHGSQVLQSTVRLLTVMLHRKHY